MTTASAQQSALFFNSELFTDVQLLPVFADSKTFADALPKKPLAEILESYEETRTVPGFSLKDFVFHNFEVRERHNTKGSASQNTSLGNDVKSNDLNSNDTKKRVQQHILTLWDQLTRDADFEQDSDAHSSLIPLPHTYIVPGGRFQEVYYWDTYFTALGLALDGKYNLILDTFKNFQFLIDDNGCVPNGNRDYYRGRSQPPVMALLYQLLQENQAGLPEVATSEFKLSALRSMRLEYDFWMEGQNHISLAQESVTKRMVRMPDGCLLNRYWDNHTGPRPESCKEDIELAETLHIEDKSEFYRHIRAACESGWDFSSRWLAQADDLASIRTCDIIPVDLNCLLYFLELSLSKLYADCRNIEETLRFEEAAKNRKKAIQTWLWNSETEFYHDYCWSEAKDTEVMSLAATLPLFFQLATKAQATSIQQRLGGEFLKPGGLITTLTNSQQQWDSPNAWAPLQWFAVIGLENYGFTEFAQNVMHHWLQNIEHCFTQYPGMMEKYNAQSFGTTASGGEYQVQEGFGWTNGVTRAFYHKHKG